MIPSTVRPASTEFLRNSDVTAGGSAPRPMSQQDGSDSHGHEMHPQKLVRLVGCHLANAGKQEAAA